MSDVHGRKREKTTDELVKARKEREAVKIKEYNELVKSCRTKMANKEYTQDTFHLTSRILQSNPDYYTIWNYRRIIILELVKTETKEQEQKSFVNELMFFLQLIQINPKSYWLWNHRIWCLQTMPEPDWEAELGLVEKMLSRDARNFHGWDYRRFVVNHLKRIRENKADIAKIDQREYEFTTKKIESSFSNYSAWHQRSKLIPSVVASMSEEEKNEVARNELDMVEAAVFTDPEDQSAWLYFWWLLGRAPEDVKISGAYQLKDTPVVILGFNDVIKFMQVPRFFDANNSPLLGKLYPLCEDSESASVWIFVLDDITSNAKNICMDSNTILPSTSARIVPSRKWDMDIKMIDRGDGAYKRVETLKNNLKKTWTPSSTKMYKDPTLIDQSAWFTLDKTQLLKAEIKAIRELLELEPDSAWALQTLVHFLNQLLLREPEHLDIYNELISTLDILIKIDSDRKYRYEDLKNKFVFEEKTSSMILEQPLDLTELSSIPLLSRLLLADRIIVSSEKLQAELNQLPFLSECALSQKLQFIDNKI